jgi:hypothetical protein
MQTDCRRLTKSKWYLPLFCVLLGAVFFGAQAIGGHPGERLVSFGILAVVGVLVLLGGRSETIRGLRGDGRDERFAKMDIHATALSGMAVIVAVIVGFLVEIAQGKDGMPFAWLGAVGGLAYIVAIVVVRLRS